MKNLKEKEFIIRKEGKKLITLTYEEAIFLADLTSNYRLEDMVELEEKRPGSMMDILLEEMRTIYIKNMKNDIRIKTLHKLVESLYGKFSLLSEKDVFFIIQQIHEDREAYISELLDTVLKDVA